MPMLDREAIDQTIETVATRRLGVAAASIYKVIDRGYEQGSSGGWYVLFVRIALGTRWQMLARRRTKAELLTLVSTAGPERLGDWPPIPRAPATIVPPPPHDPHRGDRPPDGPQPRRFRGHGRGWRVASMEG